MKTSSHTGANRPTARVTNLDLKNTIQKKLGAVTTEGVSVQRGKPMQQGGREHDALPSLFIWHCYLCQVLEWFGATNTNTFMRLLE
jgi:hypothetical protein